MDSQDDSLQSVYWRDEILQIMYWLRGEQLGEAVSPQTLTTLLGIENEIAQAVMESMVEDGYLTCLSDTPEFYQLTEWGIAEGKRHFSAEFAGLTHQGHGECNNPDCACHELGPEACEHHLDEGPVQGAK